jgi:hypothetical protein
MNTSAYQQHPSGGFIIKDRQGGSIQLNKMEALVLLEWLRNALADILEQGEFKLEEVADTEVIILDDINNNDTHE